MATYIKMLLLAGVDVIVYEINHQLFSIIFISCKCLLVYISCHHVLCY